MLLDTSGAKSTPLTGGGNFVPQESVSMRKVKEVLRLRFGLGLQQSQIARSCSIGQATVHLDRERRVTVPAGTAAQTGTRFILSVSTIARAISR